MTTPTMILPKTLYDEIWDYCRVNSITNIDEFILKLTKQGFTIEKFGATPETKEKIVEKIVEVDKIVEKEVYVSNNEEVTLLTNKINELTNELIVIKAELETERKKKRNIYGED